VSLDPPAIIPLPPRACLLAAPPLVSRGGPTADAWRGPALTDETADFGPLALIAPPLQRLDVAPTIDRHLPPDPQLAFSHGRALSPLLAARLCQPTALVNVPSWAQRAGADLLWDVPAGRLNDDRLGRALDAFFTQRHPILTAVAAQAIEAAEPSLGRLHFDPTRLTSHGAYGCSQPRPATTAWPPAAGGDAPPAHITHGYGDDAEPIQVGLTSVVDGLGAPPLLGQRLDGNHNGHTATRQQCDWLLAEGLLRPGCLMTSDRGTFSAEHVARLHRHGCHALRSAPWADYRELYDGRAARLNWQQASYLSLEQRRRRDADSPLPREHYELAVARHALTEPLTDQPLPCRVPFAYSSADEAICRRTRERDVARLRGGLGAIAATVARGHPRTTPAAIARRVARLFGDPAAAALFRWEMTALTAQEQAASPPPGPGRSPSHVPLPLRVRRGGGGRGGAIRRAGGAADDGTAAAQRRHAVHPVQAAESGGAGPPPAEDAVSRASGVPEVAAARRGVGVPDAGGVDGLPDVGAAVPSERGGRRGRVGAAPHDGVPAAAVPRLRAGPAANTSGPCGACHPVDAGTSPCPGSIGVPHPGTIVGPGVGTATALLTHATADWLACLRHEGAENRTRQD
jgi:hypothetical protein